MSIAVLAGTGVGAGSTDRNTVTTAAVDTTGADLIVAVVSDFGTTRATFSDSKGNAWTPLPTTQLGTSAACRIFWTRPTSIGSGHTFTATQTNSFPSINVLAFSGGATSPVDQQNGATFSAVTSAQPGSITPTENNELVVSALTSDNQALSLSASGMTVSSNVTQTTNCERGALAYVIQTTATAVNPTWSWTLSSNGALRSASFKAAAASGGGTGSGYRSRYRFGDAA